MRSKSLKTLLFFTAQDNFLFLYLYTHTTDTFNQASVLLTLTAYSMPALFCTQRLQMEYEPTPMSSPTSYTSVNCIVLLLGCCTKYTVYSNVFWCYRWKGVSEWWEYTCSMLLILMLLWMGGWLSSSVPVATKLNPLKSWWALALGGTPGESGIKKRGNMECHLIVATRDPSSFKIVPHSPRGVLAVNSESKYNVSSGLPMAGLKGGWISLLNNF